MFKGAAVPRRYSTSDTAAPLAIEAGAVEAVGAVTLGFGGFSAESDALALGATAMTFDVLAADDVTTRQYDLAVTRAVGQGGC